MKNITQMWKLISTIMGALVVVVTAFYGAWSWFDGYVFSEAEAGEAFDQRMQYQQHMDYETLSQITEQKIELIEHKINILKKAEQLSVAQQTDLDLLMVDLQSAKEQLGTYRKLQAGVHVPGDLKNPNDPE